MASEGYRDAAIQPSTCTYSERPSFDENERRDGENHHSALGHSELKEFILLLESPRRPDARWSEARITIQVEGECS